MIRIALRMISTGVLRHRNDIVTFVRFHPDGRWLASVSRERRVYTWDLATGQSTASGPLADDAFAEHRIAFAASGDLAASTGGRNGAIRRRTAQTFIRTLSCRIRASDSIRVRCGISFDQARRRHTEYGARAS
jgi:WD40 repeat protein